MANECRIIDSKVGGDQRSLAENPMIHALSCQWPFGKSKLHLKQSSLRRIRSNNLKLASWRAELVSNHDISSLVTKVGIRKFKGYFYKDKLKTIQPNSSYIINLNSKHDAHGNRNSGSQWVALVINDMKQGIYFDSYGERTRRNKKSIEI